METCIKQPLQREHVLAQWSFFQWMLTCLKRPWSDFELQTKRILKTNVPIVELKRTIPSVFTTTDVQVSAGSTKPDSTVPGYIYVLLPFQLTRPIICIHVNTACGLMSPFVGQTALIRVRLTFAITVDAVSLTQYR